MKQQDIHHILPFLSAVKGNYSSHQPQGIVVNGAGTLALYMLNVSESVSPPTIAGVAKLHHCFPEKELQKGCAKTSG